MQWSLLDFDGYVPWATVPPHRSDRQIVFPSVEIYDQTRASRALLDRFLTVAYADARAVWNDNRDTLGPVYEYPEEPCYSPTTPQARVDKFLQQSDLLSPETLLRRPLRLPAPEPEPEVTPIPRSLVWRQLALMKSPHTFIHQTLPRLLSSSSRALGFPMLKKISPKVFRKRKKSKETLAIEAPEPADPPQAPVVAAQTRPKLYRANSAVEPMITWIPPQAQEIVPAPSPLAAVVSKKRRRNTIDDGKMACAEQRRVEMAATPRVPLPVPSALPPRLWPAVYQHVPPSPRRLSLAEIDRTPPPSPTVLPHNVPIVEHPLSEKEMKSLIASLSIVVLAFVVAPGTALFTIFFIARFLFSLFC